MTTFFAAFAAIMSLINVIALACIDYNLSRNYYPRARRTKSDPASQQPSLQQQSTQTG